MTERRVRTAWAAVPFLVVGAASIIRGFGIHGGDFSPAFTTDEWWAWNSQQAWGWAWGWIGFNSFVVALRTQWRFWRIWTATHAFLVIMGWAALAFLGFEDGLNTTIWGFVALAVMVAWYWGLDPVRTRGNVTPPILYAFKVSVLAVTAGFSAGYSWVIGQADGWNVESVGGVAAFASITAFGLWRLLKDNEAVANVEAQRDYERVERQKAVAEMVAMQKELGAYRKTYGALDEEG